MRNILFLELAQLIINLKKFKKTFKKEYLIKQNTITFSKVKLLSHSFFT